MTTDDLEKILEAGAETQKVDFKESCPWSISFAKDILAMANCQDGGLIIVGVREENDTFTRQGIIEEHKVTYRTDDMRDQISSFADPGVNLVCNVVRDSHETEYVVIQIQPFEQLPIICRRNTSDTQKGVIYFRNSNRRIESAPVSNSYDMRDIIERAAIKMMNRYQRIGLQSSNTTEQLLAQERGEL